VPTGALAVYRLVGAAAAATGALVAEAMVELAASGALEGRELLAYVCTGWRPRTGAEAELRTLEVDEVEEMEEVEEMDELDEQGTVMVEVVVEVESRVVVMWVVSPAAATATLVARRSAVVNCILTRLVSESRG
jgi:hypothetical protein